MVQATEPTTDLREPQTGETPADQTASAAAQGAVAAVATETGAASAPTFDFESDEGIAHVLETVPQLRARLEAERKKANDDGFNAGRQNRDKELRLERGSEEVARQWQNHLADKYGIELDEADQRESPLWVRASRDRERHDYWRTQTEQVLDAFDVADRQKITAALEQFEGMPDQVEAIARQVIDTAVSRQSERRIADMTVEEVLALPTSSKLRASFEAYKDAELAKEAEAKAQERDVPPPPPRTPAGGVATARTQNDYANLSPEAIAELPEAEYRIAMGYGAA